METVTVGPHTFTRGTYDGPTGYVNGPYRLWTPVIRVKDRPLVQVIGASGKVVATFRLPIMSIKARHALRDAARAAGIVAE